MTKPRPPYLQKEITRHGKIIWYVRKRPKPRVRIHGEYGSPEFIKSYEAAIAGNTTQQTSAKPKSGSLSWLITQYRKSSDWANYSNATKRQRDNIFYKIVQQSGDVPFQAITRQVIIKSRDARANTPAQAKNFLKTFNGLFKWAVDAEYLQTNPAQGVKPPKLKNTDGFAAWTEADITKYNEHWPLGTKERVWLDVLLYTGLRRGDAVRLGQRHIEDGIATLKTEKSSFKTEVNLPILEVLQNTLSFGPIGATTFICGNSSKPLSKETFGNMFRKACNEAGINKSAHGIRKIAATRAANAGATVAQLKALFGWTSDDMASLYTKTADRRRLSVDAMAKLQRSYKDKN